MRYFYFTLLVIFVSCKNNDSQTNSDFTDFFSLEKISVKSFPLDSVTSPLKGRISFFQENNGKQYLLLLNLFKNKLIWYDYDSSKVIHTTNFEREGTNGVGNITGFYIKSTDSIFVHNYGTGTLYLCNRIGKVINNYKLITESSIKYPNLAEFFSAGYYNDTLILNTWGAEHFYNTSVAYKKDLLTILSLKNKNISYDLSYPKIYQKAVWGAQLHLMFNSYNPQKKDILSSFVIDDTLSILNIHTKELKRKYAGASFIKSVRPFSEKNYLSFIPEIEDEVKHQLTQNTYGPIYTDPFSGFSYRFINQALTLEEYKLKEPQRNLSPFLSIVILDNNYKKVGEVKDLHYSYLASKVFFTKQGMHILKLDSLENKMTFHIFKLKKHEK